METEFREEGFTIENDGSANWAIKKIKEYDAEKERLLKIADEEMARITDQKKQIEEEYENKKQFFKTALRAYFETVPHKATKTQESYKLLDGSLVYKKPSVKLSAADGLAEYLDGTEYVEVVKKAKWGEFKKALSITEDGTVINTETGEVIPESAVKVENAEESFNIK